MAMALTMTMAVIAAAALMTAPACWAGDDAKPEGASAKAGADAAKRRALAEELVSLMRADYVAAYAEALTADELLRMIEVCKYPTEGRHAEEWLVLSAKLIQSMEKKLATEKTAAPAIPPAEKKEAAKHLDETTRKLDDATRKLNELDAAAGVKQDGK